MGSIPDAVVGFHLKYQTVVHVRHIVQILCTTIIIIAGFKVTVHVIGVFVIFTEEMQPIVANNLLKKVQND